MPDDFRLFGETRKATFLSRPNRFTVLCSIDGKETKAYLPNPGRLWELLLPGSRLFLEKSPECRALAHTVVAVERDGHPVALHTHRSNDLAGFLIEKGSIPRLSGSRIIRREATIGPSRFDFILQRDDTEVVLEVKSCTLFGRRLAMFPDAVTLRGKRHLDELASLASCKRQGAVLILIYHPEAEFFLPDYHTDLAFAETFLSIRDRVEVIPVAVRLKQDLSVAPEINEVAIPWEILEREAKDRGSYIVILRLRSGVALEPGPGLKEGFYIITGQAGGGLSKEIARLKKIKKIAVTPLDRLREACEAHATIPFRTGDDITEKLVETVRGLADEEADGLGTDSGLSVFYMKEDPMLMERFHRITQYYRMDRLVEGV